MNIKAGLFNFPDKTRVFYFKESFSFRRMNLLTEDTCIQLKKDGVVTRGWGHSPKLLLPVFGKNYMVQLVNDRDGNPCDPFNTLNEKEKVTESTIQQMAKEQHYKSISSPDRQVITKLQLLILGIATFLFLCGGIIWSLKSL